MKQKRARVLFYGCLVAVTLCASCHWWICVNQQHHDHNRQLINALTYGNTKSALDIVNSGADPNIPQSPPLPPSLNLLFHRLLPRKQLLASDRQTALMMACGLGWRSDIYPPGAEAYGSEDVSLVQSMLIYGAYVQARNSEGKTSLHFAVMSGRLRTEGGLWAALPYDNGREHGTAHVWGRSGALLGSYTMDYGTGIDFWWIELEGKAQLTEARAVIDNQMDGYEYWFAWDSPGVLSKEKWWSTGRLHGIERAWNEWRRLRRGFPKYWVYDRQVDKRAVKANTLLRPFRVEDDQPYRIFPPEVAANLP